MPQDPFTQLKHSAELMLASGPLQFADPGLASEPPHATMIDVATKLKTTAMDFFMTAE